MTKYALLAVLLIAGCGDWHPRCDMGFRPPCVAVTLVTPAPSLPPLVFASPQPTTDETYPYTVQIKVPHTPLELQVCDGSVECFIITKKDVDFLHALEKKAKP